MEISIHVLFVLGVTCLIVFLAKSHLTTLVSQVHIWKPLGDRSSLPTPCNSFVQKLIWEVKLPHAISHHQSAISSVDINNDTISDIIIGFDSGLNLNVSLPFCQ